MNTTYIRSPNSLPGNGCLTGTSRPQGIVKRKNEFSKLIIKIKYNIIVRSYNTIVHRPNARCGGHSLYLHRRCIHSLCLYEKPSVWRNYHNKEGKVYGIQSRAIGNLLPLFFYIFMFIYKYLYIYLLVYICV